MAAWPIFGVPSTPMAKSLMFWSRARGTSGRRTDGFSIEIVEIKKLGPVRNLNYGGRLALNFLREKEWTSAAKGASLSPCRDKGRLAPSGILPCWRWRHCGASVVTAVASENSVH